MVSKDTEYYAPKGVKYARHPIPRDTSPIVQCLNNSGTFRYLQKNPLLHLLYRTGIQLGETLKFNIFF